MSHFVNRCIFLMTTFWGLTPGYQQQLSVDSYLSTQSVALLPINISYRYRRHILGKYSTSFTIVGEILAVVFLFPNNR